MNADGAPPRKLNDLRHIFTEGDKKEIILRARPLKTLLVYFSKRSNTLSYVDAYPEFFKASKHFASEVCNLANKKDNVKLYLHLLARSYDIIILLHSIYSNSNRLRPFFRDALFNNGAPKVVFLGNEYKNIPEKLKLCKDVDADIVVSQSLSPRIHRIYEEKIKLQNTNASVVGMPNSLYCPDRIRRGPNLISRPIDIGFRAYPSPLYLGHQDREEIFDLIEKNKCDDHKLDLSLNPADRFSGSNWFNFLRRCKFQLGVESGADVFDTTDSVRKCVNALNGAPLGARGVRLESCFPPENERVPLRTLSSRILEAAATRTPQILFSGHYDGIISPDKHYISLEKDGSNILEVIEKTKYLRDGERMADRVHTHLSRSMKAERILEDFYWTLRRVLGT